MTILGSLAASTAVFLFSAHVATIALASWRCRLGRPKAKPAGPLPGITLVRPLCGLESHSRATIEASFRLDYPDHELIFCVANAGDPIIPLVERAMSENVHVPARLLIGEDQLSANPKLNNMAKGWRAAKHDLVVFADSNLLVTPDYLQAVVAQWQRPDTGMVSAPPIGSEPEGLWGEVECALLNTHAARWQYAADALGLAFAQGKTLSFRRSDFSYDLMKALGEEPAEDAAATKCIRAQGLNVRLVAPPYTQPLARRDAAQVWSRHLRWTRLRRMTFPLVFIPEICTGLLVPLIAACLTSIEWGMPVWVALIVLPTIWYGCEILLARIAGWPLSWRSPLAFILRDLMLPLLYVSAWTGSQFEWRGNRIDVEKRAHAN
jgi:ceramide glucosyltransferase